MGFSTFTSVFLSGDPGLSEGLGTVFVRRLGGGGGVVGRFVGLVSWEAAKYPET